MPNARQYRHAAAASVPGMDQGPPFSFRSRESSRPRLPCCLTLDLLEFDLNIGMEIYTRMFTKEAQNLFKIVY